MYVSVWIYMFVSVCVCAIYKYIYIIYIQLEFHFLFTGANNTLMNILNQSNYYHIKTRECVHYMYACMYMCIYNMCV